MDMGISQECDLLFSNVMSCVIAHRQEVSFWLAERTWYPRVAEWQWEMTGLPFFWGGGGG